MSKWKLFLWTIIESLRRMVTPFVMYLFMSTIAFAALAIGDLVTEWLVYLIAFGFGVFYNAHLMGAVGEMGYKSFVSGEKRRMENLSTAPGKDYKPYQEYRPWKGFLTGAFLVLPVIILLIVAENTDATTMAYVSVVIDMLAGWALIPIQLLILGLGRAVSYYWGILICIIPVLVSGVGYIVGAMKEKKKQADVDAYRASYQNGGKKKKKK